MASDTRKERVVLETARYRITGEVTLPAEGVRTRLSDLLNAEGLSFISLVDAELTALDGAGSEHRDFVAVARDHVQIAYEDRG
jgi:hypothetical protein